MGLDEIEDRRWLPAFVLGREIGVGDRPPAQPPHWFHVFEHRYGGNDRRRVWLGGCVFRLAANADQGTGKLWLLTRALVELGRSWLAMGDPVRDAREVSGVRDAVESSYDAWGGAIENERLVALNDLLGEHLAYPGLSSPVVESGHEALLRLSAPSLPYFDGWELACACRCAGEAVEVATVAHVHECATYNDVIDAELRAVLGGETPRIYLVWENSV